VRELATAGADRRPLRRIAHQRSITGLLLPCVALRLLYETLATSSRPTSSVVRGSLRGFGPMEVRAVGAGRVWDWLWAKYNYMAKSGD
jgi:hypothetical protein